MSHTDVLFRDLHVDNLQDRMEIESLCLNCHENGITQLLLTKLPFYREYIVSSFYCGHCEFSNNSTYSASKCQDKGVKFILRIVDEKDLKRFIVLSKNSLFRIPELDSEFPITSGSNLGITTVESALLEIIENIKVSQDERRKVSPELSVQIDKFVEKLENLISLKKDFILELIDPSGNSLLQNYLEPKSDPELKVQYYKRTQEENEILYINDEENNDNENVSYLDEAQDEYKPKEEAVTIFDNCSKCNSSIECRMTILNIPNFKEVIVMASSCNVCGLRENQVINGCGIADKGQRITLHITEPIDRSRDVIISESAHIYLPEYDLKKGPGNKGGRVTTVEGILDCIADQLHESSPFLMGDSATETTSENNLGELIPKLRQYAKGEINGLTLIISDPAGNCFVQDIYSPEQDPRLLVESYDRTDEENDELGINNMNLKEFETI